MAKLIQIKNGEYVGADKYVIADAGQGKSTLTFSPDRVITEGTPIGAEILNEMQKNSLIQLSGTKRTVGSTDFYDCTLEGITEFEFETLTCVLKVDTTSTNADVKLNFNGTQYKLVFNRLPVLRQDNECLIVLTKANTQAKVIIDVLDAWRFYPKEMPGTANLDDYVEAGVYNSRLNSNTITNKPNGVTSAFTLIVYKIQPENNEYVTQILIPYNGGSVYLRNKTVSWRNWTSIMTKNDYNALKNLVDTKLDKGGYTGNAQSLKTLIDTKFDKTGGLLTGGIGINVDTVETVAYRALQNGDELFRIGTDGNKVYIQNRKSPYGYNIRMYNSGSTEIYANNLQTSAKEVVGAVNELLENEKRLAGLTNIRYVQDTWTKEVGDICVDKVTKKLYGVKYRTSDTSVTTNFYELTVANLFKKTTEFKVTTLNKQVPRDDSSATLIPYDRNYRYITIVGYYNTTYAVETNQVTVDCYMTNKLGNDYFYTLPLYYRGARQCTIKVRVRTEGIQCSAWTSAEPQGYIAKAIYHN